MLSPGNAVRIVDPADPSDRRAGIVPVRRPRRRDRAAAPDAGPRARRPRAARRPVAEAAEDAVQRGLTHLHELTHSHRTQDRLSLEARTVPAPCDRYPARIDHLKAWLIMRCAGERAVRYLRQAREKVRRAQPTGIALFEQALAGPAALRDVPGEIALWHALALALPRVIETRDALGRSSSSRRAGGPPPPRGHRPCTASVTSRTPRSIFVRALSSTMLSAIVPMHWSTVGTTPASVA